MNERSILGSRGIPVLLCAVVLIAGIACGNSSTPTTAAQAGGQAEPTADAHVKQVRARLSPAGTWTFFVTVRHDDAGWEDFADGWDVVTPDGTVLKPDAGAPFTRQLMHPHTDEQPFTRSQSGITIPEGVNRVTVRAHDKVHGWGGEEVTVDLTVEEGERFQVVRPDPDPAPKPEPEPGVESAETP